MCVIQPRSQTRISWRRRAPLGASRKMRTATWGGGGASQMLLEFCRWRSVKPILDRESGNALEVLDITRNQCQPVGEGDRGDAEIGLVEPPSGSFEPRSERTVYLGGIRVEWQD